MNNTVILGETIEIGNVRPSWLLDSDIVGTADEHSTWSKTDTRTALAADINWRNAAHIGAIRLPVDHPYYLATSRGFEYWPGDASGGYHKAKAPDWWDGGEVLARDGSTRIQQTPVGPDWMHTPDIYPELDIIGIKRRVEVADMPACPCVARPYPYVEGGKGSYTVEEPEFAEVEDSAAAIEADIAEARASRMAAEGANERQIVAIARVLAEGDGLRKDAPESALSGWKRTARLIYAALLDGTFVPPYISDAERALGKAIPLLREGAERFRFYEEQHRAKADPASPKFGGHTGQIVTLVKANANAEIAARFEAFLAGKPTKASAPPRLYSEGQRTAAIRCLMAAFDGHVDGMPPKIVEARGRVVDNLASILGMSREKGK